MPADIYDGGKINSKVTLLPQQLSITAGSPYRGRGDGSQTFGVRDAAPESQLLGQPAAEGPDPPLGWAPKYTGCPPPPPRPRPGGDKVLSERAAVVLIAS